jgi:membrane-bound ClpP family serine protease
MAKTAMSEEGETFFVNLAEKLFGVILIIIGAIMIYLTASTSGLGAFALFFGILSFILLIIGLFLLLVRASE